MPITPRFAAAAPTSRVRAPLTWRRSGSAILLCGASTLVAGACGHSSPTNSGHSTAGDSNAAAGNTTTGGSASNTSGGNASAGNAPIGDAGDATDVPSDGGAAPADTGSAGAGGEGGASTSSTDDGPALGGDCTAPGALACAGPHQKLTLLCSADKTWAANQTCASGQYCSSTAGPDLGICKAPSADCASRQPGEAFCSGTDMKDATKCDVDGIDAKLVEHCADRCVDGKCEGPAPCPENIIYSCDPKCPGDPAPKAACFNLCETAPSGLSPLLDLSQAEPGTKYSIALPAVAGDATKCPCTSGSVPSSLDAFAFRLPPAPSGEAWLLTYPESWEVRTENDAKALKSPEYRCQSYWPNFQTSTPGCTTVVGGFYEDVRVWLFTKVGQPTATSVTLQIMNSNDAVCPQ